MSLYQISEDLRNLEINNRAIRWLAKHLPATIKRVGRDYQTDEPILGLLYDGWTIELDFLNVGREVEDDEVFWWAGWKDGMHVRSTCHSYSHLINSIRKHCRDGK